jgi:hypothetical protein
MDNDLKKAISLTEPQVYLAQIHARDDHEIDQLLCIEVWHSERMWGILNPGKMHIFQLTSAIHWKVFRYTYPQYSRSESVAGFESFPEMVQM